jgi:glyoxylase-like metal-dependent hydrolase (beta-lactamase superfamily II)
MPAPLQGPLLPTVYRFKLGGFEVATILDARTARDGFAARYAVNAQPDEVAALAVANNHDPNRFEHGGSTTLLNTGKELVLFDTGNGPLPFEHERLAKTMQPGNTAARLETLGHKPEDVDVVVITHGHPDHIGGLTKGGKPVFPNARYVFGAAEYDFWQKNENIREARKFNRELFVTICTPLADRSTFIKSGDAVVPGVTALDVSGHSAGMLAFNIESEGKRVMVTADTFNHYLTAVQRPEWHFDMDDDKEKAVATRKRMLDMLAADRVLFASFHMPFPTLGWIDRTSKGYAWVPHAYQLNT